MCISNSLKVAFGATLLTAVFGCSAPGDSSSGQNIPSENIESSDDASGVVTAIDDTANASDTAESDNSTTDTIDADIAVESNIDLDVENTAQTDAGGVNSNSDANLANGSSIVLAGITNGALIGTSFGGSDVFVRNFDISGENLLTRL